MKRVYLLLLISIFSANTSYSQIVDVKTNIAAGCIAIYNPSVEVGFSDRSSITFDYMGAFAKKNWMNSGYPLMFSMGLFGYRYYTDAGTHEGLFVGGDFGLDVFRMNKNIAPFVKNDKSEDGYDVGYGYLLGATVGYKYMFHKRWGAEASLSYGFHHAQHEGYNGDGVRYVELNPSAEWMPYKAGIYIIYRLLD